MLQLSATKPEEIGDAAQMNSQAQDGYRIEEITHRAHQIHREHGGVVGYDFDDWTQAWQESSQMGNEQQASFGELRATCKQQVRLSGRFRQIALHAILAFTACIAMVAPVKAQSLMAQKQLSGAALASSAVHCARPIDAPGF